MTTKKKTQKEIIGVLTHKFPYIDFSKFTYKNQNEKSTIVCNIHGDRLRSYRDLKRSVHGCDLCSGAGINSVGTTEVFLQELKLKFGEEVFYKYDFSKTTYVNARTPILIICPTHGEVYIHPNKVKTSSSKTPCKYCNIEARSFNQKDTEESFLIKARKIHGEKDDYSRVKYLGSKEYITLKCLVNPEHGEYQKYPNWYLSGQRCPTCSLGQSSHGQEEVLNFCKSLDVSFVVSRFKTREKVELDIFIPTHNLAIEYNGLFYHSEEVRGRDNLSNKLKYCESIGIDLIHIFEDEWLTNKEIVKKRITSKLGVDLRIYARKTSIKEVPVKDTIEFIKTNHLQGPLANTSFNYALFKDNEMVAVMTFFKVRFGKKTEGTFELARYCSSYTVVGGFSKLLKFFIQKVNPSRIISYSDNRWGKGNVYRVNGFTNTGVSAPGYFWCKNQKRENRWNFQKYKLKTKWPEIYSDSKTEEDMCKEKGYVKLKDCGVTRWELTP